MSGSVSLVSDGEHQNDLAFVTNHTNVACPNCQHSFWIPKSPFPAPEQEQPQPEHCSTCNGEGWEESRVFDGTEDGHFEQVDCHDCGGSGKATPPAQEQPPARKAFIAGATAALATPAPHQEQPDLPSLKWERDEDAHLVHLLGFPHASILADGATREEALHKLGDILFHHFNDYCTEPEAHSQEQPDLRTLIDALPRIVPSEMSGEEQWRANKMDKFFVVVTATATLKVNRETGETWRLDESNSKWIKIEQ